MEKSLVSLDKPISIRGLTIVPVVKMSSRYSFAAGIAGICTRQPIAVVIVSPAQKKAFRTTGEEVSLEQLAAEFPALAQPLENAQKISGQLVYGPARETYSSRPDSTAALLPYVVSHL
mgnify:CR=1 FL=1